MSDNGTAEVPRDEVRDLLREAATDTAAGFFLPGHNPYADDRADRALELGKLRWPDGEQHDIDECPDVIPGTYDIDAKFVCARPDRAGRFRASARNLTQLHVRGFDDLEKMREATGWAPHLKMREDWAPDPFAYGQQTAATGAGVLATYVPLWPGPVTRQLYWSDYFAMSAKAFEAYNHDPISWRSVHMKQEFTLGKGLQSRVTFSSGPKAGKAHDVAQAAWDEFWKRNKMDARMDTIARDLSWGGEQFLRYFRKGKLLTVRGLDPASIYDIITDPEDLETVFAYHQQFQTPYQIYAPQSATPPTGIQAPTGATQPGSLTRFIIRQILPQEIDHYRVNQSQYERRGRSDLYPALGWIKRLRDYLTSHVIRSDLIARICWDLQVNGNQPAVDALKAQMFPNGQAPPPGSVFGHNQASKLEVIAAPNMGGSGRWDPILDAMVTMIGDSIGLPKDWLGFGQGTTRANALVATEPAARSLEDLQGTIELIVHDGFDRVMAAAGITDAELETTFPSIATEDRTQKLQDLAFAESNGWISKATSANIAAKELGITNYDFEEEQGLIAEEFPAAEEEDVPDADPDPVTGKKPTRPKSGDGVIRRPMIAAQYRQAAKLDPTKSPSIEDEPAGELVPTSGPAPAPEGPAPAGVPPTRAGAPADENPLSGAGAKNIRQDNTREASSGPRRRPDDPEYAEASRGFRTETATNLADLVRAAMATSNE